MYCPVLRLWVDRPGVSASCANCSLDERRSAGTCIRSSAALKDSLGVHGASKAPVWFGEVGALVVAAMGSMATVSGHRYL